MSALQATPGMVVFRRYLGSFGGLLAALSVALYVYASRDPSAPLPASLLHAAGFGFAHGVALAALDRRQPAIAQRAKTSMLLRDVQRVRPSADEVRANPRARSAILRTAVRSQEALA